MGKDSLPGKNSCDYLLTLRGFGGIIRSNEHRTLISCSTHPERKSNTVGIKHKAASIRPRLPRGFIKTQTNRERTLLLTNIINHFAVFVKPFCQGFPGNVALPPPFSINS